MIFSTPSDSLSPTHILRLCSLRFHDSVYTFGRVDCNSALLLFLSKKMRVKYVLYSRWNEIHLLFALGEFIATQKIVDRHGIHILRGYKLNKPNKNNNNEK